MFDNLLFLKTIFIAGSFKEYKIISKEKTTVTMKAEKCHLSDLIMRASSENCLIFRYYTPVHHLMNLVQLSILHLLITINQKFQLQNKWVWWVWFTDHSKKRLMLILNTLEFPEFWGGRFKCWDWTFSQEKTFTCKVANNMSFFKLCLSLLFVVLWKWYFFLRGQLGKFQVIKSN